MKSVNLKALVTAFTILHQKEFGKLCSFYEIAPKPKELESAAELVKDFDVHCNNDLKDLFLLLDKCYFGYSIPQISKEFDCLWVSKDMVIDIELKCQPVPEEKMKQQLKRNRYYLNSLEREVFTFTFESQSHQWYQLDKSENFHSVQIDTVARHLYDQVNKDTRIENDDIDSLFDPCSFLVSPFNSTERFLSGEYFLTSQQEEFKKSILDSICANNNTHFYAITGPAGSGKTLLLYDIAKELRNRGKEVLILHSGNLNDGHKKLLEKGWKIGPSKDYCRINWTLDNPECFFDNDGADVIIIDESQRSYHLQTISDGVLKKGLKCLFSYDPVQYLNTREAGYKNENRIQALIAPQKPHLLSSCIRTNTNIRNFVERLFDKSKKGIVNKGYVDLCFCSSSLEVKTMLDLLNSFGYAALRFTPSTASFKAFEYEEWFPDSLLCAHEVIGQEFDAVACVIGPNVRYDARNHLESSATYHYEEIKMLYQIMSRARRKLFVIVFNNSAILNRCLDILSDV